MNAIDTNTAAASTIRKGTVVTVTTPDFTQASVWRATTEAEVAAWYASDESKGMTSGGETKLPPTGKCIKGGTFTVTRSRVSASRGYHTVSKCVEMVDADGTKWFARRANCTVVA